MTTRQKFRFRRYERRLKKAMRRKLPLPYKYSSMMLIGNEMHEEAERYQHLLR